MVLFLVPSSNSCVVVVVFAAAAGCPLVARRSTEHACATPV